MKYDISKDYYGILGVPLNATTSAIAREYRKLVSRYHPDKHQGNALEDLAREKLIGINEAYEVLSNPERRAAYDAARRNPSVGSTSGPANPDGKRSAPSGTFRKLFWLLFIVLALPFFLRFVRSPRAAVVIAVAVAIAWFGPRLLKRLKK